MIYTCKHYKLHELVYPELYNEYNKKGLLYLLWGILDSKSLMIADKIWEYLNARSFSKVSVIINNWKWGGNFRYSGLRPFDCPEGSKLSMHKYGKANDLKWNDLGGPEALREYMKSIGCFEPGFRQRKDSEALPFVDITRIEWIDNMSWFHYDTSNGGNADGSIRIVGA
jgi:hypothetical protein